MQIQTRLKSLRQQSGEKIRQTADALGVTYSALSNYENGLRSPSVDVLSRAATHYGCSIDYIVCRTDEEGSVTDRKMIKIQENLSNLDESDMDLILKITSTLLDQSKYN